MRRILVTTGNGMFGRALIEQLLDRDDVLVRAMVRDRASFKLSGSNLEVVVGDMDDPASLVEPTKDVSHVFLTSPMDERITARESAVVDACAANGSPLVVNIYGAVRHEGDHLDQLHTAAIDHLKLSGLPWTLVSPSSVMETSLAPIAAQLPMGMFFGMSGGGKVGLVALEDVARVMAEVVLTDGHEGQNYLCTGPAAVDMTQVAAAFSEVLGREIRYEDLPEDDFADLLLEHAGYSDRAELEVTVLCHLRAWKEGRADLVTKTVEQVTGRPPMSVSEWISGHVADFQATT
ncbi:MAG: hypothetical protein FJW94_04880 [Actinobacteria bacterium]|nr:hypothetical protein [Actinomycetota bacterium]